YSIGWSATQTLVPSGVEFLEIDTRGRNAKWTGTDERDRAIAEHTAQAIPPPRAAAYTERGRSFVSRCFAPRKTRLKVRKNYYGFRASQSEFRQLQHDILNPP